MALADANLTALVCGLVHLVDIHLEGQHLVVKLFNRARMQHPVQSQAVHGHRICQSGQSIAQIFSLQNKETRLAAIGRALGHGRLAVRIKGLNGRVIGLHGSALSLLFSPQCRLRAGDAHQPQKHRIFRPRQSFDVGRLSRPPRRKLAPKSVINGSKIGKDVKIGEASSTATGAFAAIPSTRNDIAIR